MRIRRFAVAAIAVVGLLASTYVVCSRVLANSYASQEGQDVARNVQRARSAFDQVCADLHGKATTWGEWDDGYRQMADKNDSILRSNLKIDIVLVLDAQGKTCYSKSVSRIGGLPPPAPDEMLAALNTANVLAANEETGVGYRGIVPAAPCPILVVVQAMPAAAKHGLGPFRLVIGRYFSPLALRQLSDTTGLDIRTWPLDAQDIPEDGKQAIRRSGSHEPYIHPVNDRLIAGYTILYDTLQRPVLLLRVTEPRTAAINADRMLARLMPPLAATLLVFGTLIILALEFVGSSSGLTTATAPTQTDGKPAAERAGALPRAQSPAPRADKTPADLQPPARLASPALKEPATGYALAATPVSTTRGESTKTSARDDQPAAQPSAGCGAQPASNATAAKPEPVGETAAQAGAEEVAGNDALTNLPNRTLFMHLLQQACGKAQHRNEIIAVVRIDVDNFKDVQLGLGPKAADDLLIAIADRLTDHTGPGDTVARLGGNEFSVLLDKADSGEAAVGATQRIADALDASIPVGGQGIFAITSVGMAVRDDVSDSPGDLLRNANTAMHAAKAAETPGVVVFDPSLGDHARKSIDIDEGLGFAIERQQLLLLYHPLIDLESGRVCGAEALLRWNHPTLGMIQPGAFLPIAEATGLILPIGYWTLEAACRQLAAWRERHVLFAAFTMNIKVSGAQLQAPDVVESVREVLLKTRVDATQVNLEITESAAMTDKETTVSRLEGLRTLGVRIAMDEYGKGYSSLNSLEAFPLNSVKIDGNFVRRLLDHESAAGQIVKAITSLSSSLHMDVTAAGVETADQATKLKSLGCDMGQGYLYARPLTAKEMEAFVIDRYGSQQWGAGPKKSAATGTAPVKSNPEAYYVAPKVTRPGG